MSITRTYEYRAHPTDSQKRRLDGLLDLTRELYNAALEERREAYRRRGVSRTYYDQCKELTLARRDIPALAAMPVQMGRGPLNVLHRAFQAFFRRIKSGDKPGFPRFKGKHRFRTLHLGTAYQFKSLTRAVSSPPVRNGDAGRRGPQPASASAARGASRSQGRHLLSIPSQLAVEGASRAQGRHPDLEAGGPPWRRASRADWWTVKFKSMNPIRFRCHRPLPADGKPKEARLVRDAKGWKFQIVLQFDDPPPQPVTQAVGIDLGIEKFLTTSEGEMIPNPRILQQRLKAFRREKRSLARKKRGSGNRRRQARRLAREYMRVKDARRTFHFQVASWLVAKGKAIVVEDLNIKGLARSRLARSVNDVGWAEFIKRLEDKAESAGVPVVKIDPAYTSQDCSGCGERVKKALSVRVHRCPSCSLTLDRDHNAAINIMEAGLRLLGDKLGAGPVFPQALAKARA